MASSDSTGAAERRNPFHGEYKGDTFVVNHGDASTDAARILRPALREITPRNFSSTSEIRNAVKSALSNVQKTTGVSRGKFHPQHAQGNHAAVEKVVADWENYLGDHPELRGKVPEPDQVRDTLIQSLGPAASVKAPDPELAKWMFKPGAEPKRNTVEHAVAGEREQRRRERENNERFIEQLGKGFGASNAGAPALKPGTQPIAAAKDVGEMSQKERAVFLRKVLEGEKFGHLNSSTARRLVDMGFNPLVAEGSIDAAKWGLNAPSIRKLMAAGWEVKNPPGQQRQFAGFTERELVRGREDGPTTAHGATRVAQQTGLFRRKTVYNADGSKTVLQPRYTAKGAVDSFKRSTVGAAKRSFDARAEALEAKRLRNPFYRINAIERLHQDRKIRQLEGELGEETTRGFRRWYLMTQLRFTKYSMVTKGWLTLLFFLGIAFAPWIGMLEWTGWALATVASSAIKAGAFVLVNAYNLVASLVVSFISLVGNTIAGTMEKVTNEFLVWADLGQKTGAGEDRVFAYSVTKVDISFPSWPSIAKPKSFDGRPLVDIVLRLFGVKWSVANEVRKILNPEN